MTCLRHSPLPPKGLFPLHVALLWDERGGLVLSIFMLLSWQGFYTSVEGGTVIPTLTVCREMGMGWLTVVYGVCLLAVPDLHRGDHHLRLCGPV